MKIGFPNHPRKNLLSEIGWIGKNNFDFADLFLEEDIAVPEKINIQKTKKLLQKYKLGIIGHTAWYLPIGSPIKSLRAATIDEAIRYFEIFKRLNIKFVAIHANWPTEMFSLKEGIKWQVETLKNLIKEAKNYDLNLMYEPLETWQDNIENISTILNEIPDLSLLLDLGHANLFGRNPEEFINKFYRKLKHIHLHDNFGEEDLHLPMGVGSIDWPRTLKTLKKYYDGTITLEIFSRDKDYILLSKEKLRKLWGKL